MWLLHLRSQQVIAIIASLSLLIAATFILINLRLSVSIQERPWPKHALGRFPIGQLEQNRGQGTKSFRRNSPDPIVAQFSAWLTDECSAWGLDSFFLSEFEHADHKVRGVGVARNFTAGETTVCVPHKCWFHIRNAPQRILDLTHGLSCSADHVTALWLAEEVQKGNNSFWAPYIAMLPSEDDFKQFHPAYLEGFKPPTDIDAWQLWNYDMQACYSEYQGRLHQGMESSVISLGDAKLSFVRLFSRHYDMVGMVPLADLPNTGRQHNVQQTYLDFKSGTLCLNASRNLHVGEEVLVNYGAEQLNPLFMFLTYGFALDPHDHLPMSHAMCVGLRLGELLEPPRDANLVHMNFVRFARRYCSNFYVQEDRGTHLSHDDEHHKVIDHPLSDRLFVVEIGRKTWQEDWGFQWLPEDLVERPWILDGVTPESPAALWNTSHALASSSSKHKHAILKLRTGDRLFAVNGNTSAEALSGLKNILKAKLTFVRGVLLE